MRVLISRTTTRPLMTVWDSSMKYKSISFQRFLLMYNQVGICLRRGRLELQSNLSQEIRIIRDRKNHPFSQNICKPGFNIKHINAISKKKKLYLTLIVYANYQYLFVFCNEPPDQKNSWTLSYNKRSCQDPIK